MEIVISIAAKIAEYSVAPIGRSVGYLIYYNRNVKTLEAEVENLGHKKSGVQGRVDAAKRNLDVIEPEVEIWLTAVNVLNDEVKTFLECEVEINKSGCCSDPISRYSLSRKAKKKTQAVTELKGKEFPIVSSPAPPLGIEVTATGDFADFESRKLIMDEIIAALKDDNINAIGICGLGGVGKTTAVKKVALRAKLEKLFDEVVTAVVTQTPDLLAIQAEIAEQLGLELKEEILSVRARRLRKRLLECKSILVILDDVWQTLKLEEIGIPSGGDHKGCKLMMTSRRQEVCIAMGTRQPFTIGVLSEQEAWSLFKDKAGDSIDSGNLHQIATEVIKECGGLPIAIVTVGIALKDKPKAMWEDALLQLRQASPENIFEMHEKVYRSLELSFNFLESQEAKLCLLLCCIFKEDANIPLQDLVRYGMGLDLFKGVEDMVQATNRVGTLVKILKSCYLLLDSEKEECVKMHDVVRDVIRHLITTTGKHGLMLRHGLELKEWPTESRDELYTSISLISNKIQEQLLLLESKEKSTKGEVNKRELISLYENMGDPVKMPDNLFERMKEQRVLELRRMFIPSPPSALSLLTKLRTLCIQDCNLENISFIGELKMLMILSFRGSSIQELPREIGNLTHLLSLDLTGCRDLKRISPGVLSSLIRLEQLCMRYCENVRWEVDEEGTSERNNVELAELKSLSDHLTTLEIDNLPRSAKFWGGFKKLERFWIQIGDFPKTGWYSKKLERFWIQIGGFPKTGWYSLFANGYKPVSNELIINLDSRIPDKSWINEVLKKTEILHFGVCGVKNVVNNVNQESLVQLKFLKIVSCDVLQYVFDTVDLNPESIFPILEALSIYKAENMKMICRGQLPAGSFAELRSISLDGCKRLENVFSESIATGLVQLEILNVRSCNMMEEIVVTEKGAQEKVITSKIRFPKLRELYLDDLPSLVGFSKKMGEIEFPQLRRLYLGKLPELRSLCPSSSVGSEGNDEYDDSATQHLLNQKMKSLCELRSVTVGCCKKVENIFSSSSIQSLLNLEEVKIKECDLVEVALDFMGVNIEEGDGAVPLSRLKKLELLHLPKLICVWKKPPQRILDCQNLQSLQVARCSRLKNIFSLSTAKIAEQLQELDISKCEMMTEILAEDEGDERVMDKIEFLQLRRLTLSGLPNLWSFFPKSAGSVENHLFNGKIKSLCELRSVTVLCCEKLLNVFSPDSIQSLLNLEELKIKECDSVEVVFDFVGMNIEERLAALPLSRLKKLELSDLPKLICVWKKPPQRIQDCQNLESLRIETCSALKNIFSPSTAKIADQLQELHISECEMMTEILAEDEGDEKVMDKIEFLQLRRLTLSRLPNLCSFFPRDAGSVENHLFNGKVSFPRLEILEVDYMENFGEIWCSQLPSDSFCELRVLKVSNCDKILQVAPFHLLTRLHNLEEVHAISCNSLEEVFEFKCPNVEEGHAVMLPGSLKHMNLNSLKRLSVSDCANLRNLFNPSVTRGLVHLQELYISNCVMMEEIVTKGEEPEKGTVDEIVLPQLKSLWLSCLQNLTSFCQGLYAFDLPSLDFLSVGGCPKMRTFSLGFASTPKLKGVAGYRLSTGYREEDLMGDLNNTIQQLFQRQWGYGQSNSDETESSSKGTQGSLHLEELSADCSGLEENQFHPETLYQAPPGRQDLEVNQATVPQENDAQRDQSPN